MISNLKLNIIDYNISIYVVILFIRIFVVARISIHAGLRVKEQIYAMSHFFPVAPAQCFPPARNQHRRTPSTDGKVTTLVAPAQLHRMSARDVEMAARGRSVNSARRVAALVALTFEQ